MCRSRPRRQTCVRWHHVVCLWWPTALELERLAPRQNEASLSANPFAHYARTPTDQSRGKDKDARAAMMRPTSRSAPFARRLVDVIIAAATKEFR